ncbi:NERD domain-containing protein [Microbacterium sp. MEC084]|uniref:nuclease-related domain-containing protein n=1 Tax=Microbacterium sp. MEC084 TaxID=1963027 RepID=UPI001432146B|nr:nuclease-related domain-containing protein [Microbacterium sp. MEC084]MCD1268059.1 NERD domain-containing protein [Microbacterium sp. MEC084]
MSAPAASVIAECLRAQASVAKRERLARVIGRSPLSADSRPWYLGALGELDVARRLAALGPDWAVAHSIPIGTRGSDIDHLVVGPAGVFTINSKFHEGARVWVGSRRLLVNGQKTDHIRNARFEASRVKKVLTDIGAPPVVPIVAVVGAREVVVKAAPIDVFVLRAEKLTRWLAKRPVVLSSDQLSAARQAIVDPRRWGVQVELTAGDYERFAALRREVKGAKRTRLAWALGALTGVVTAAFSVGLPPALKLLGY